MAYGYEWLAEVGLYHVGARAYDPRTARWLQRDPIGVAGGHPNVYGYCGNSPLIWKDPSGLQFVIFVHGSFSSPNVFEKSYIGLVKETLGATAGHHVFAWGRYGSGWGAGWAPPHFEEAGCELAKKLRQVREKFPNEPIYIVAHSNGGNVAIAAAQQGAPVDVIIRLGSPYFKSLIDVPDGVKVLDFYDPADNIQFDMANAFGGAIYGAHNVTSLWESNPEIWAGWKRFRIDVRSLCDPALTGRGIHQHMYSEKVWRAIGGIIQRNL